MIRKGGPLALLFSKSARRGDPCGRPKDGDKLNLPKRKNMRLPGYDYSGAGGYFITVCTNNRTCILSRVHGGSERERASLELTELGRIAQNALDELAGKYGIRIAACAIMPNHIHLILMTSGSEVSAGRFVGAFKSVVSNRWQKICDSRGIVMGKLWQRDFYDHILRNEADYLEKLKYIDENPDKWQQDELFCD